MPRRKLTKEQENTVENLAQRHYKFTLILSATCRELAKDKVKSLEAHENYSKRVDPAKFWQCDYNNKEAYIAHFEAICDKEAESVDE